MEEGASGCGDIDECSLTLEDGYPCHAEASCANTIGSAYTPNGTRNPKSETQALNPKSNARALNLGRRERLRGSGMAVDASRLCRPTRCAALTERMVLRVARY